MKPVLFTLIAAIMILAGSCFKLGDSQYYSKITANVNITGIYLPDTVNVNDTASIFLVAKAYSTCWSDLRFELSKINDFEYNVQALGTYESYGSCAETTVSGDSTIAFKPTKTGLYKFYFYKSSEDTETDTLIVR
jgi:hypothetical protein